MQQTVQLLHRMQCQVYVLQLRLMSAKAEAGGLQHIAEPSHTHIAGSLASLPSLAVCAALASPRRSSLPSTWGMCLSCLFSYSERKGRGVHWARGELVSSGRNPWGRDDMSFIMVGNCLPSRHAIVSCESGEGSWMSTQVP